MSPANIAGKNGGASNPPAGDPTDDRKLELRDAMPDLATRSFSFEVRATGDDGTVEGYGSVFNVEDAYADKIAPGAFSASLKAHKSADNAGDALAARRRRPVRRLG